MNPENQPPWLRQFNDAYRVLDLDTRTEAETSRQARCITRALRLQAGDKILDIACATGRHAVQLAVRGHRVMGLDLNEGYLALAKERANAAGTTIEVAAQDMRDLPRLGSAVFDAAVMMYSSFGYFATREDNLRVIQGVRHVLRPGGQFLLDIINRDWFIRSYSPSDYASGSGLFVTRDFQEADGHVLLHENEFRASESTLSWSVSSVDDPALAFTINYRMYSVHEIIGLIEAGGLRVSRILGGYDCASFSLFSPRILCVATRP